MPIQQRPRRFGPVPNPRLRQYTVILEDEDAEWGKRQPGGLSSLLRLLLASERKRKQVED